MASTQLTDGQITQDGSHGIAELAKLFKERENEPRSEPFFGVIKAYDPLMIQLDGKKVLIDEKHITALLDLYVRDEYGRYKYENKRVAMLMYNTGYVNSMPDFLVLGVVQ